MHFELTNDGPRSRERKVSPASRIESKKGESIQKEQREKEPLFRPSEVHFIGESPVEISSDGFYRPSTIGEVQALIKWAKQPFHVGLPNGPLAIRVRGAGHTFPRRATFTNSDPGVNPREINIRLCKMREVTWVDEDEGIVDAEAGINLRCDPNNYRYSDMKNGLLQELASKNWTLLDLG